MRYLLAAVAAGLVLSACTSGGAPALVESRPTSPAGQAPPRVEIRIVGLAPAAPPPPDARCDDLIALAAAGDHKPVVDQAAELSAEGVVCPLEAVAAIETSRQVLASADDLIRSSTASKRDGDYHAAKRDLHAALDIYPKYYWASKLLRDLGEPSSEAEVIPAGPVRVGEIDAAAEAEVEVLRRLLVEQNLELARLAEQQGDLSGARRWTLQAMKAEPRDAAVRELLVEHARLLGLKFFSAGELTPAREIWTRALSLHREDRRLNDYLRQIDERLENLEEIRRGD